MHSRRPLPALALVMPHPQLPTRTSLSHFPASSPHTPRACTPSTPILFPKQLIASPRTSIDSWNSSNSNGEDDVHWEWQPEQTSLLARTLDALPGHLYTPFNGPVPPSNLLDKIARSVSQAQGPLEWPHSVRATRAKLVEIARARDKDRNKENMTIDEQDEDEVVEVPGRPPKKPLYRQSSMDFLPSRDKGSGSLSRLSSRLQRTDRVIAAYHPYARPASRSPSPPALLRCPGAGDHCYFPTTPIFAPLIPQRTLRPRTSSTSLGSRPIPTLRRAASTMSSHSNPTPGPVPSDGVLPPPINSKPVRVSLPRRSDSFSYAAPVPPTLKRAPSFGATSIASGVVPPTSKQVVTDVEKQSQDPESDDEEKARQKKVKRPRVRSTHVPEKKKKQVQKVLEGKAAPSSPVAAAPKPAGKPKLRTRSGSIFGAELPLPQPDSTLPTASPKPLSPSAAPTPITLRRGSPPPPGASTPGTKTLRRVKTTTFNLRPCLTARRISFGSLVEEQGSECEVAGMAMGASALGSAFQMS